MAKTAIVQVKFLANQFFYVAICWHIHLETRAVPFPFYSTEVELVGDSDCAASAQWRLTVNSGLTGLDLEIITLWRVGKNYYDEEEGEQEEEFLM